MRLVGVLPMGYALSLVLTLNTAVAQADAADSVANGVFLVAARNMRDPNFKETVVLITQPPGSGPFGVIINRPLEYRLSALFPENETLQDRDDVLYFGGPVRRQTLIFLVRSNQALPRAAHVLGDVYFTSDFSWVEGMLKRCRCATRLARVCGLRGVGTGPVAERNRQGRMACGPGRCRYHF